MANTHHKYLLARGPSNGMHLAKADTYSGPNGDREAGACCTPGVVMMSVVHKTGARGPTPINGAEAFEAVTCAECQRIVDRLTKS